MTHPTKNEQTPPSAEAHRLEWVTPEIRRMASGGAENGGRANVDGGIFQS